MVQDGPGLGRTSIITKTGLDDSEEEFSAGSAEERP